MLVQLPLLSLTLLPLQLPLPLPVLLGRCRRADQRGILADRFKIVSAWCWEVLRRRLAIHRQLARQAAETFEIVERSGGYVSVRRLVACVEASTEDDDIGEVVLARQARRASAADTVGCCSARAAGGNGRRRQTAAGM